MAGGPAGGLKAKLVKDFEQTFTFANEAAAKKLWRFPPDNWQIENGCLHLHEKSGITSKTEFKGDFDLLIETLDGDLGITIFGVKLGVKGKVHRIRRSGPDIVYACDSKKPVSFTIKESELNMTSTLQIHQTYYARDLILSGVRIKVAQGFVPADDAP